MPHKGMHYLTLRARSSPKHSLIEGIWIQSEHNSSSTSV